MVNALMFDKSLSSSIYGSYTGLVYLTPLIGGYVADRYWGNRRSILVGGILMAIGQFFMFSSGLMFENHGLAPLLMYVGLGFLIFGNGFFKPNISTMVGQLYPAGDRRVDSAFTIFYMGINLGAGLAPDICGGLGETYDGNGVIMPGNFKWGFLAAGIGMMISTISFEILKNKYIVTPTGEPVGAKPKPAIATTDVPKVKVSGAAIAGWIAGLIALFVAFKGFLGFDTVGAFIYAACLIAPAYIITDKSLTKEEQKRIWVIYIIAFFVIFFWSAFEQAGASLTFFAQEQTNRNLFGTVIPASFFQSINAIAIVVFAPLFAVLWSKLSARGKEPSSPKKQAFGLLLLALGYLLIAFVVKDLNPAVKVSMIWLISLYMIHTFGELCLSPIGLSMVVKLAPLRFASLLMGVWFLSTATANKFAGELSALYPEEVKKETTVAASAFKLNGRDVVVDENTIASLGANGTKWQLSRTSDNAPAAQEPSFGEKFKQNLFGKEETGAKSDSLTALTITTTTAQPLSEYQQKLTIAGDKDKKLVYGYSEDGNKLYVLKNNKTLDVWNLNPTKPKFVGIQINDLFDFFMIFVVMAGVASGILFLLSPSLLRMMGGIR
jgi:POT family proton-dependent oligopeptide transporter